MIKVFMRKQNIVSKNLNINEKKHVKTLKLKKIEKQLF